MLTPLGDGELIKGGLFYLTLSYISIHLLLSCDGNQIGEWEVCSYATSLLIIALDYSSLFFPRLNLMPMNTVYAVTCLLQSIHTKIPCLEFIDICVIMSNQTKLYVKCQQGEIQRTTV